MNPGLGVGGYCLTKDPLFAKLSINQIFKVNKKLILFCHTSDYYK